MRRSRYCIVILLAIIIILLLLGCTVEDRENELLNENEESNEEGVNPQEEESLEESGVYEGDKATDFYIEDNSGNSIQISGLKGKTILLNFWTSWSVESESTNTIISECRKTFKDDLEIISVNVTAVEGNNLEYILKYIEAKGYNFPIYFDLEGDVAESYLIRSFPTTYLINNEGYITKIYIGEINENELIGEIRDLIEE